MIAPSFGAFPLGPAPPVLSVGAVAPRMPPTYPGMAYPTIFYWPYPSPPVSPGSPFFQAGPPPHITTSATPPHPTIVSFYLYFKFFSSKDKNGPIYILCIWFLTGKFLMYNNTTY